MRKYVYLTIASILSLLALSCFAGVDTNIVVTKGLKINVVTVTGNYVMVSTNSVVLANATSSIITVTLPTASGCIGQYYNIKKIDTSSNAVIVDGEGSETIEGDLTYRLRRKYESVTIISDGIGWFAL